MGLCLSKRDDYTEIAEEALYHVNEGRRYDSHGETQKSLEHYESAVALDPNSAILYVYKGVQLAILGRRLEAIESHKQALRLEPHNLSAQYYLAGTINVLSNIENNRDKKIISDDCRTVLMKVINAKGTTFDDFEAKGLAYQKLGDIDGQIRMFQEALEIKPDASLYNELGGIFTRRGQYQEAADVSLKALDLDETFSHAWYRVGRNLQELGQYAEAIGAFELVLKHQPDDYDAYHALGGSYRHLAQDTNNHALYENAVSYLQTALEHAPNDPLIHCNLGVTLYLRKNEGDEEKGFALLNKAFELYQDPENRKGIEHTSEYIESVFSKERAELLEKFNILAETKVDIIAPGESNADPTKIDEFNIKVAAVEVEKKKVRDSVMLTLGEKPGSLNIDMAALYEQVQRMAQKVQALEQENTSLKEQNTSLTNKITTIESTAVSRLEVAFAISMNLKWTITAKQETTIKSDANSFKYWDGFRFTLNSAYGASKLALEGTLVVDNSSIVASGLAQAASLIPFAGNVASDVVTTLGAIVKSSMIKQKAARFTKIASDPKECAEFVLTLATKITLHPTKAAEIHNEGSHKNVISAWGKFVLKLESFGEKVSVVLEGDRYDTPAAKKGHLDACLLIEKLGDGTLVIEPKDSLIDRCIGTLIPGSKFAETDFGFDSECD